MATVNAGHAKLYTFARRDTPFAVVFRDPTKFETSGRHKRVTKWFADKADAKRYRDELNERLLAEGTVGVTWDADMRADASAARRHLDRLGHTHVALLTLAQRFTASVASTAEREKPIGPILEAFLHEKTHVEGAARETVRNLAGRLGHWFELAHITTLGDIGRNTVEVLRTRDADPQTRRNDMSAASSFCTWLVDKGRLEHHPLKGLRRPKVPQKRKPVHTADEVGRLLTAARGYQGGKWLGSVVALYFTGARPSELAETRFLYGRHPVARIEGGKLRGRANRTVALVAAAVAWLRVAGCPERVPPLTREVRRPLCRLAGVAWRPDIPRHTYITCRLLLVERDALVAREAGTSEAVIHRNYRNPEVTRAQARAWAAVRPGRK